MCNGRGERMLTCWTHVDRFGEARQEKFENFCSISIMARHVRRRLREAHARLPDIFTAINGVNIFGIILPRTKRWRSERVSVRQRTGPFRFFEATVKSGQNKRSCQ